MIVLGKGFGVFVGVVAGCYCIWLLGDCWWGTGLDTSSTSSEHPSSSRAEWFCQLVFALVAVVFSATVVVAFGSELFPDVLQSVNRSSCPACQPNSSVGPILTDSGAKVFYLPGSKRQVTGIDCTCSQASNQELATLLQQAPNIEWLNLSRSSITGDRLSELSHMSTLRSLGLSIPTLADDDLAYIRGLSSLIDLDLESTQITDAGLVHLKGCSNLRHLNLENTKVTDRALLHLSSLEDLRTLRLSNTDITDNGVQQLHQAIPNCKIQR